MNDIEKRAHDLAISYTMHQKILEYFDENSLKMVELESDYFDAYDLAYFNFMEILKNQE